MQACFCSDEQRLQARHSPAWVAWACGGFHGNSTAVYSLQAVCSAACSAIGTQQQCAACAASTPHTVPLCVCVCGCGCVQVVKVAWGLLVQHHCWYEFACCLLVKGSLQHLRQTAAAQPQQPCSTAALQQVLQLVQLPLRALREQVHELPAAQMAACAAAFIAWVQHPLDPTRCVQADRHKDCVDVCVNVCVCCFQTSRAASFSHIAQCA